MPSTNDIRNTLSDPKPLYFAAGVIDKIREEAPSRIAAVRATDPKEVQERFTKQAKETQAKVSETLGSIDTDIKKLREQAQSLALQGVGVAAEYAVKAREAYDELADRGRVAVKNWRGEDTAEVKVEREPVKVAEPPAGPQTGTGKGTAGTGAATDTAADTGTATGTGKGSAGSAGAAGSAAKKTTARKTTTAKTTTAKSGTAKSNGTTESGGTAKSNGTKSTGSAKSEGNGKQQPGSGS